MDEDTLIDKNVLQKGYSIVLQRITRARNESGRIKWNSQLLRLFETLLFLFYGLISWWQNDNDFNNIGIEIMKWDNEKNQTFNRTMLSIKANFTMNIGFYEKLWTNCVDYCYKH